MRDRQPLHIHCLTEVTALSRRRRDRCRPHTRAESRGSGPSKVDAGERRTLRWRKRTSHQTPSHEGWPSSRVPNEFAADSALEGSGSNQYARLASNKQCPPPPEQFVDDSPLEGSGFEPSVPLPRLSSIRAVRAKIIGRSTDVFRRDREFDVRAG